MLSPSFSSTQQGKRIQRNAATPSRSTSNFKSHKFTDTRLLAVSQRKLDSAGIAAAAKSSTSHPLTMPRDRGKAGEFGTQSPPPAEPTREGLSGLREPPGRSWALRVALASSSPLMEFYLAIAIARPIRPTPGAPESPPGAPRHPLRSCRENGAYHPISLPGNQKDQTPSPATKWRLPLGPQNRHDSLVSGWSEPG